MTQKKNIDINIGTTACHMFKKLGERLNVLDSS